MFLFTFTILESEKPIIWPVPAVVLGVMAPKRAYSTPFGPWPGPAECLWNCPSELRQFSSCCLPLPKLRPPRPTFASLWRVVAAIVALFQVPWRRKTGVGKAIFSIGCCCLAYRWRRTRYFAYKIMTGTCFMTDLAP